MVDSLWLRVTHLGCLFVCNLVSLEIIVFFIICGSLLSTWWAYFSLKEISLGVICFCGSKARSDSLLSYAYIGLNMLSSFFKSSFSYLFAKITMATNPLQFLKPERIQFGCYFYVKPYPQKEKFAVSQGMEQISESQNIKKVRISWKSENVVKTFLEACIHEVAKNGRNGASLKALSWKNVAEKLKVSHNLVVDQKQMKNHYDYLKGKYLAWSKLKNKSGNVYDPVTNTFNLSEEEWNIEMKGNKYIESLKSASLLFPKLCTQLFEEVAIKRIEDGGSSSTRSRSCAEPILIEENGHMNETPETSTPNCSCHAKDERPTKKTKALKNPNTLVIEEDTSKALKLIIDRKHGPSFKDCQDKLRNLGWGAKNPLHKMALVIFCESATYREAWLHLQADEVEDWVRMIGHRLGLVV